MSVAAYLDEEDFDDETDVAIDDDGSVRPLARDGEEILSYEEVVQRSIDARNAQDWAGMVKYCSLLEPVSRHSAAFMRTLGQALCVAGDYEGGKARLLQAIALDPNEPETHAVLGACYGFQGDWARSAEHYDHALRLGVDMPAAHWNRSLNLLNEGDFGRGWEEYEWGRVHRTRPTRSPWRQWYGSRASSPDKILYIYAEQGYGDTIQFVRLVKQAKEQWGGRIVLEVQPLLVPLLYDFPGTDVVVAAESHAAFRHRYDEYVALMSLPYVFGWTTPADIPPFEPYIRPRTGVNGDAGGRLKVGICWRGSPNGVMDAKRSMSIDDIKPLLSIPKTAFVSLLRGAEIPEGIPIAHADLRDWSETAAIIADMDVVISVDTAVAHLAGAMGKHVFMMSAMDNDWRWMRDRSDSPWYPSMLIVRQTKRGDWTDVIKEVARVLKGRFLSIGAEGSVAFSLAANLAQQLRAAAHEQKEKRKKVDPSKKTVADHSHDPHEHDLHRFEGEGGPHLPEPDSLDSLEGVPPAEKES